MATSANPKFAHIARPYAYAAFDYAREKQELPIWKKFLNTILPIVSDKLVVKVLSSPEASSQKIFDFVYGILKEVTTITPQQKNLLLLLNEKKRLLLLPEIIEMFNNFYDIHEKITVVRVITAVDISDEYRQKLVNALKKREKHDVTVQSTVDPSIIGGAIIYIGDKVIDGSVRGKLTRLLEFSLR